MSFYLWLWPFMSGKAWNVFSRPFLFSNKSSLSLIMLMLLVAVKRQSRLIEILNQMSEQCTKRQAFSFWLHILITALLQSQVGIEPAHSNQVLSSSLLPL